MANRHSKQAVVLAAAVATGVSVATAAPPVAAGTIVNPVWGFGVPLPVDKAAWSFTMDCEKDVFMVRGENVAAGTFELYDAALEYGRGALLRSASAMTSGAKTIVWSIPFAELRVDRFGGQEFRGVSLNRRVGFSRYPIGGAGLRAQEPCRGLYPFTVNRQVEARLKGDIPESISKGRRYRLPSRGVQVYPQAANLGGAVTYRTKTVALGSKGRACRIVSDPGKKAQYLMGLKPGMECVLVAIGLPDFNSANKFQVGSGPVGVIKVTR